MNKTRAAIITAGAGLALAVSVTAPGSFADRGGPPPHVQEKVGEVTPDHAQAVEAIGKAIDLGPDGPEVVVDATSAIGAGEGPDLDESPGKKDRRSLPPQASARAHQVIECLDLGDEPACLTDTAVVLTQDGER